MDIIKKMEYSGYLMKMGERGGISSYTSAGIMSKLQRKGTLWMGDIFGLSYIFEKIKPIVLSIEVTDTSNTQNSIGTGVFIDSNHILTCHHVIDQKTIIRITDGTGRVYNSQSINIYSDPGKDISIIKLKNDEWRTPVMDIAFRNSIILEKIVCPGYPPVPFTRSEMPPLTCQSGEICGTITTYDNIELDLFSATARPGNSGGPIFSMDGRIIGMVTRSLERKNEESDVIPTSPFFSCIRSEVIRESVKNISGGKTSIVWEDYE